MLRTIQFLGCLSLGFVVLLQTGCDKSGTSTDPASAQVDGHDDHGHGEHAHAEDFGGAIEELAGLAGTISESMAKGDADAAHDPLHEIGHVLEGLPELAKQEGLSEEQLTAVNGAVATLMDSYGELDGAMHGEEGKSWDDLKAGIDSAVAVLTAFDHGDHDHGKDSDHAHEE